MEGRSGPWNSAGGQSWELLLRGLSTAWGSPGLLATDRRGGAGIRAPPAGGAALCTGRQGRHRPSSPSPGRTFPARLREGGNAWVMLPLSGEEREDPAAGCKCDTCDRSRGCRDLWLHRQQPGSSGFLKPRASGEGWTSGPRPFLLTHHPDLSCFFLPSASPFPPACQPFLLSLGPCDLGHCL